jgi:hypothetical protein
MRLLNFVKILCRQAFRPFRVAPSVLIPPECEIFRRQFSKTVRPWVLNDLRLPCLTKELNSGCLRADAR